MSATTPERVACPECGANYRWTAQLAGHKIRCKCGVKMRLPNEAGGAATVLSKDTPPAAATSTPAAVSEAPPPAPATEAEPTDGEYDLDLPDADNLKPAAKAARAVVAEKGVCPSCNAALKPGAVICLNCGFNVAEGTKLKTAVAADAAPTGRTAKRKADLEEEEYALKKARMTDVIFPSILLGVGMVMVLLNAWLLFRISPTFAKLTTPSTYNSSPLSPNMLSMIAMVQAAISFVLQIPFLIVGVLIVARLFGTSFGSLVTALLKLAALAIFMIGFGQVFNSGIDIITGGEGWMATMINGSINFGLFMGLVIWMFDLDGLEAFVLYLLTSLLPMLAIMFFGTILFAMFARP